MFDFLPSTEPDESDPTADDQLAETVEDSASTIPAAETPAVVSGLTEGPLADSESPAEPTSEEIEASNDTDEEEPPDPATEKKAPTVVPKAATGEGDVIDLPDFSHEPTDPGQYTLRIVFTFRPGDQSVLLSTQSHDVLAIVGELEPKGARALLGPFIAAHDGRLSEIKQALTKSPAKAPPQSTAVRSNAAKKTPPASSTSSTSTKTPAAKKDKPTKVVKPTSPAALPQTNLFNE